MISQPKVLHVLRFELLLIDHVKLHDFVELARTGEAKVTEGAGLVMILDIDAGGAGA